MFVMALLEASNQAAGPADHLLPTHQDDRRAGSVLKANNFDLLPWSAPAFPSVKGVLHQPEAKPTLKGETRGAILLAVAKARSWIDDVASGCVRSFAEIAEREGKVERHIRPQDSPPWPAGWAAF
jgi:hypothetical protein